jgi:hypothetical protein
MKRYVYMGSSNIILKIALTLASLRLSYDIISQEFFSLSNSTHLNQGKGKPSAKVSGSRENFFIA